MKPLFSTRPLNDGTHGFRFDIIGCKGLYRKRKFQRRFGLDMSGDTFAKIHFGKRSLYLEQLNPARALGDFALLRRIQGIAAVAKLRIELIRQQ